MQGRVSAREHGAAVLGVAAVPSGNDATGAFHDGDQGLHVVGLQAGFHDHVHHAHGEHAVGVAVATEPHQPGLVGNAVKGFALLGVIENIRASAH